MKLRTKTLLLISFSLISLIVVLYASLSAILLQSFQNLENQTTERNVKRIKNAFQEELQQLSMITDDWASWDDTYEFIVGEDDEYVTENVRDSTFTGLDINVFVFATPQGDTIYGEAFDLKQEKRQPLPADFKQHFTEEHPMVKHDELDSETQGLLVLDEQVLMFASQPILTSEDQGPIRGAVVLGRYLNDRQVEELGRQTQLDVEMYRVDDPQLSSPLQEAITTLKQQESPILIRPIHEDEIVGYSLLEDFAGQPALLVKVTLDREIYKQGQRALNYLLWSLLGIGVFFGGLTVILLEKLVLFRLERLSKEVRQVGESNDLALRVWVKGDDELSGLGRTINQMLTQLEQDAAELAQEQKKVEGLLLNILPETIANRLKQEKGAIAENFDEVTILFADIVGFTPLSMRLPAVEVVGLLNDIFSTFDQLTDQLGLEKIKTIGDAYMVAGGLPVPREDHADAIAQMALAMIEAVETFQGKAGETFEIRIGINTGVVVAGVIGTRKFIYDLWGDTVNIASRMESHGEPGRIQVTEATYQQLKDHYEFQERGKIEIKGRGPMTAYWLLKAKSSDDSRDLLAS